MSFLTAMFNHWCETRSLSLPHATKTGEARVDEASVSVGLNGYNKQKLPDDLHWTHNVRSKKICLGVKSLGF